MAAAVDPTIAAVGPRVKALREAMGLSPRGLAERSGVSAPMLSQVERGAASPRWAVRSNNASGVVRGETSRRLRVASKIASGRGRGLRRLLRLEEGGMVAVVRRGGGGRGGAGGHAYEVPAPPLPGLRAEVTRHALAAGAVTG